MKVIDLNADIGEGMPWDDDLLGIITSANVCCGAYAGSIELTHQTVNKCKQCGVRVGAHPGYPDREGFGRRSVRFEDPGLLSNSLYQQVSVASSMSYLKPHGALYHDCAVSGSSYTAVVQTLESAQLALMGMERLGHRSLADAAGVPFLSEGFADRGYSADGLLLPRTEPGAMLNNRPEIEEQVLTLAESVDTICIHGDSEGCVKIAEWVRLALENHGLKVGAGCR